MGQRMAIIVVCPDCHNARELMGYSSETRTRRCASCASRATYGPSKVEVERLLDGEPPARYSVAGRRAAVAKMAAAGRTSAFIAAVLEVDVQVVRDDRRYAARTGRL